jgi:hypothetical protein
MAFLMLSVFGACLMNVSASAILTAEETSADYSKAITRGGSTTFDILVTNLDTSDHYVDMDYTEPSGFVVITNATNDQVFVNATGSADGADAIHVGFTVTAKTTTKAGDTGTIPVDFKIGTSVEDSITLTVSVTETYGVTAATNDATLETLPGGRAGYQITLKNTGNVDDVYILSITGIATNWDAHIYSAPTTSVVNPSSAYLSEHLGESGYNAKGLLTSNWVTGADATATALPSSIIADSTVISAIAIAAGDTDDFWVYHDSPLTATNGSYDNITLKAESKGNSTDSATLYLITTVRTGVSLGVSLTTDKTSMALEPDETDKFTITVQNTGTVTETIIITAITDANIGIWTIALDDDQDHTAVDAMVGEKIDSLQLSIVANGTKTIYCIVTAPSASQFEDKEEISIVVHAIVSNRLTDHKYIDYTPEASGGTKAGEAAVPGFEAIFAFVALGVCVVFLNRKRRK